MRKVRYREVPYYGVARELYDKFVPNTRNRRDLAHIMDELISYAHQIAPRSWEVTVSQSKSYIKLNVGRVEVFALGNRWLFCNLRDVGAAARTNGVRKIGNHYRSLKGYQLRYEALEDEAVETFIRHYSRLKDGILLWIEDCARDRSMSLERDSFSREFVDYLSKLTGRNLPYPGYFEGEVGSSKTKAVRKNYVIYHNSDKMRSSPTELTQGSGFRIVTNKNPELAINNRIWLIAGEGSPRRFYLCYSFVADKLRKSSRRSTFKYTLDGREGARLDAPILLNKLPWFRAYVKSQFFSHGLTQLPEYVAAELEKLAVSQDRLPGDDILKRVGLKDGDTVSASTLEKVAERMKSMSPKQREVTTQRLIRNDSPIVKALKKMTGGACQFPGCGVKILKRDGTPYSEVAHIQAIGKGGKSAFGNLLVLCPNHHTEFDFGERVIELQTPTHIKGRLNGKPFEIHVINENPFSR